MLFLWTDISSEVEWMEPSVYIFKFSTWWQTLLQSDCTNFHTNSEQYVKVLIALYLLLKSTVLTPFQIISFLFIYLQVHDTFLGFLHSSRNLIQWDFINFIIVLNSKMSICFLFIISTFHLSFTILSFITSTFSFVILITLHLHSFVIIPPSGISQLIFFSFDSNTIFLVPLMLSNLGVYPGQWENCMVENLDSVIFFWKAFTYCLSNNYMIRLHLQSVSFEISTNSILSTIFFFFLPFRQNACMYYL